MTALDRLIDAIEAGKTPAAGTYKLALTELDAMIEQLWERLMAATALRGRLIGNEQIAGVVREFGKVQDDPPSPALGIVGGETACSECERPARVWYDGTPYCKRHAAAAGIDFHGKV